MSKQWDEVTVKELLDLIKQERDELITLEKKALNRKDYLSKAALRREGNHCDELIQDIMRLVTKISPE